MPRNEDLRFEQTIHQEDEIGAGKMKDRLLTNSKPHSRQRQ